MKKQTEITERNKLIAQFMGLSHLHNQTRVETLKYHSSWDWLMPVVEKIEKTFAYVNIKGCAVNISTIIETSAPTKIEATWIAVVMFIKWYNE